MMKARLVRMLVMAGALGLGACALIEDRLYDRYAAFLSGGSIAQGQKGDLYGRGTAEFWAGEPPFLFCYDIEVAKIEGVTAAHIHRAPETSVGLPVLTLSPPADGQSNGCLEVSRRFMAQMKADPGAFYIDIHSAQFPRGALRGQIEHQSPDVTPPIR